MAVKLSAYKIDEDGRIRIKHTFYGRNEDEATRYYEEHQNVCKKFGPAVAEGRVIVFVEEIDEIPTTAWLEEQIAEAEE